MSQHLPILTTDLWNISMNSRETSSVRHRRACHVAGRAEDSRLRMEVIGITGTLTLTGGAARGFQSGLLELSWLLMDNLRHLGRSNRPENASGIMRAAARFSRRQQTSARDEIGLREAREKVVLHLVVRHNLSANDVVRPGTNDPEPKMLERWPRRPAGVCAHGGQPSSHCFSLHRLD